MTSYEPVRIREPKRWFGDYFRQQHGGQDDFGGQGLNDDDSDVNYYYDDKDDDNLTGEIVSKAGREEIPFSDN